MNSARIFGLLCLATGCGAAADLPVEDSTDYSSESLGSSAPQFVGAYVQHAEQSVYTGGDCVGSTCPLTVVGSSLHAPIGTDAQFIFATACNSAASPLTSSSYEWFKNGVSLGLCSALSNEDKSCTVSDYPCTQCPGSQCQTVTLSDHLLETSESGSYNVKASNGTRAAVSGALTLSVVPQATVVSYQVLSNGHMKVKFQGVASLAYWVMASTDLSTWTQLGQATAGANGQFSFEDVNSAQYASRFYSAVVVPAP